MFFNHGNIKEQMLKIIVHMKMLGEKKEFRSLYANFLEINVPIHKLLPITKGCAPTVSSESGRSITI
jgi:hypothetical protein